MRESEGRCPRSLDLKRSVLTPASDLRNALAGLQDDCSTRRSVSYKGPSSDCYLVRTRTL